ncbi:HEAT repeat domain-containing protein [Microbacterium suwonense]|uniref:HEAT repeat domain-containing protein n=1 Tax=Microbacterium suwonense TaxID=683047 RepID=A0ABM8FSC9_9MICO|nr:HEAT repeat domain-containing protein [Microbacterium suwonense]BDZ38310.1 hypothetical protein GCM10025863_09240 [Microbacterium suwonense]
MVQDSSPRGRISAAAQRCGEGLLVQRCIDLLSGRNPVPEAALLDVLGGNSARAVMAGHEGGVDGHWPRVWALRTFLYVWDPRAEHEVAAAGGDDHWRVREMAAKVLAARRATSGESERLLHRLLTDSHERVRAAAARALTVVSHGNC